MWILHKHKKIKEQQISNMQRNKRGSVDLYHKFLQSICCISTSILLPFPLPPSHPNQAAETIRPSGARLQVSSLSFLHTWVHLNLASSMISTTGQEPTWGTSMIGWDLLRCVG